MHCCLVVCSGRKGTRRKIGVARISVPILYDRSTAKRRETMANDRLLYFMAQLL